MLQIFILKNPWKQPNLSFIQRLLYTNFAFYWGFASARLIMLLAPPAFFVFSINLCDATASDLICYAAPVLIASLISTQYFYGRVRWPFMSQLYEIIQSIYVTRGLIEVARNPKSPSFKVTPKGEVLSKNFISSLTMPFYLLLTFNVTGIVWGLHRYTTQSTEHGSMSFVMFWAVLDFIFLLSALGVMLERQQLRQEPRVPHQEPISLSSDVTKPIYGTTINASNAGVRLLLECDESQFSRLSLNEFATLEFHQTKATLHAKVVSSRRISNNSIELGMLYKLSTVEDERNAISVAFGSSKQLAINNKNRHQGRSIANGLINMGRFGLRDGTEHVRFLITMLFKRFKNL